LSKLILFGEGSLMRALTEFVEDFHIERPHQGKGNVLLFPSEGLQQMAGARLACSQRLGGFLRYYFYRPRQFQRTQ
jgi:putative transposase